VLKRGYFRQILAEAEAEVEGISPKDASSLLVDPNTVFVDVRDIRELQRDGYIPGAFHAPRGMLEFWIDPDSPYHKPIFATGKSFVFYCALDWRATLSAQLAKRMGLAPVRHLEGGLKAWREAGCAIEPYVRESASKD